jgi:hypothetical protein
MTEPVAENTIPVTTAYHGRNMDGKLAAYTAVDVNDARPRVEVSDPNTRAVMIAIAEQGEKLRRLLIILFVWVPIVAVAIWLAVTLILAHSQDSATPTSNTSSCSMSYGSIVC